MNLFGMAWRFNRPCRDVCSFFEWPDTQSWRFPKHHLKYECHPIFKHFWTTVSGVQNHTKSKFEDVAHEPQLSADAKFTLETRLLTHLLTGYGKKKTWYNCPKETIAFPHLWKRLPSSQRLNRLVAIVTNKGEGHLSSAATARARQGQRQALFFG